MKKIVNLFIIITVIAMTLYTFYSYIYLSPGTTVSPQQKTEYAQHSFSIAVHAGFGAVALFAGMFQLMKRVREKFSASNIILRKIYYFSVLISAVTGLYVATYAQGGLVNKIGFFTLDVIWILSIIQSFIADKKDDMPAFRIWIVRNYALTFASVTLRLWLVFIWNIYGFELSHFSEVYQTLGFLCWVPNLVFIEWFYLNKAKLLQR